MIRVAVQSEAFNRQLGAILRRTSRPRAILQAGCRGGLVCLQRHFRQRDRVPNRLGGRRTHFWLDVLRSTQLGPVTDRSGLIVIGDARFPQKLYGGPITAKNTRNLAIPVNPEAHGLRPRQFETQTGHRLFFMKSHSRALLAHRVGEDRGFQVDYVLKPGVFQPSDPLALPPWDALEAAILSAADAQLALELQPPASA